MTRINPRLQGDGLFIADWLVRRTEISVSTKVAYARLVRYYNPKTGYAWPSLEDWATAVGISKRQLSRDVRDMTYYKLIEVERIGLGGTNRYYFLDHEWMHEDVQSSVDKLASLTSQDGTTGLDGLSSQCGQNGNSFNEALKGGGSTLKRRESNSKEKILTPNTLRRVLPPKGGFPPPEGFTEFHKILLEGIPSYAPNASFWATVERYKAIEVVDEAHRMVVWFADHPNKRKGANSFILNWLKRSSQDLVRQANDHRSANREQPALPKWEGGVNPFAAYG